MAKTRVPGIDPRTSSGWLLKAFDSALKRDPVDAANDAEYLGALLAQRADDLLDARLIESRAAIAHLTIQGLSR